MKINKYIASAEAYSSPGWPDNIEDIIRLGMNEGDFISPHVIEYIKSLSIDLIARHYPPGEVPQLIETIKQVHDMGENVEVLLYPGSDNGIDNLIRTFSEPGDTIIMRLPEYGNTVLFAQTHGLNIQYIEVDPINNLSVDTLLQAYYKYHPAIIYFSNPHNPSGQFIPPSELNRLAEEAQDSLIIIDEAYIHFADITFTGALPLVEKYPNIAVTRTFSKLFGLAGLRIGFTTVNKTIAHHLRILQRIKDLTFISQMAALKSLEHIEEYRQAARDIMESRAYVENSLRELGFHVIGPSYGNFVLFKPTIDPKVLYERLHERGYITRFYTDPRMAKYMRVSIWKKTIMEGFIRTLKEVL
ncbi:aminotransferase class I/II-fold pyridoxal phosphate-dependent enzyme [bacterium 3DAC]|nr:aminotransferase class I/II-fold pyridoxal phosphate-dependent enzyme [bacterium 3DAC]